eukprot:269296-Chlamydomonas_euryale.AAC.2
MNEPHLHPCLHPATTHPTLTPTSHPQFHVFACALPGRPDAAGVVRRRGRRPSPVLGVWPRRACVKVTRAVPAVRGRGAQAGAGDCAAPGRKRCGGVGAPVTLRAIA